MCRGTFGDCADACFLCHLDNVPTSICLLSDCYRDASPTDGLPKIKPILTEAERLQKREEMARRRKRQNEQRLQDEQVSRACYAAGDMCAYCLVRGTSLICLDVITRPSARVMSQLATISHVASSYGHCAPLPLPPSCTIQLRGPKLPCSS